MAGNREGRREVSVWWPGAMTWGPGYQEARGFADSTVSQARPFTHGSRYFCKHLLEFPNSPESWRKV